MSLKKTSTIEMLDGAFLITAVDGKRVKVSSYGDSMIRLQLAREGEPFYSDDHYEMVEHHDWTSDLTYTQDQDVFVFSTAKLRLFVDAHTLQSQFYINGSESPVLKQIKPANWHNHQIKLQFDVDANEHFTGLGHGYYARAESIDLKNQVIQRNYGAVPIEQAPLLVPFYMSSKGYGVFLNSTFANAFSFGADNEYSFLIDDNGFGGRMDYFFIAGPKLTDVLDHYTQLTGRPRLPQKAMFGLQLSDKGHDHNSDTPSDIDWWKQKIAKHRAAGYPLDHVVNDNRWRANGGKRCQSKLAWDEQRYPDPAAYQRWLKENGLVITLDFNRCIAQYSDGWQAAFNLPETGSLEFPKSAPDLTNKAFQNWFWRVFKEQALKPEHQYPGDALWIDEFDEQGNAPKNMVLSNGLSSAEMRNYWFFLISKALVEQGWDKSEINKRPFVWVRGMTAGAQRYATLWSGDIYPNYKEMQGQIRGMQLAGLSGFPYWGHDAGGFYDWNTNLGPDEQMYKRWAMAFGSFAPIWKPHGMGQSRWPLDRSESSQSVASKYTDLRYRLMPYIYNAAKQAAVSGLPMARPMLLEYQDDPLAWQYDLQYMWGDSLLVAPLTADDGSKNIWLPKGTWYEFETASPIQGDKIITVSPNASELPIFVKAGAIIPQRAFALSTAFIDKTKLIIHLYTGANGTYTFLEDDDVTEDHRLEGAYQRTTFEYIDDKKQLLISGAKGHYQGAPESRDLEFSIFGLNKATQVTINDTPVATEWRNGKLVFSLLNTKIEAPLVVEFK